MLTARRHLAVALLLLLSATASVFAQAVNGTLLGTVTDSTGANVSGAKVTVMETKTGLLQTTKTNNSGNYTIPNLPPGDYTVSIEATGFKKDTHQNIDLQTNTSTRVDVALVNGSVTESVVVTTAPPTLQTDRADISTKLESKQVADLPMGTGRNFQSLLNLVPGTTPATFQHSQFFNSQNSLQTQANGAPRMGNLYQIEGIDDDERTGLLQIIIPPAEAIQSVDISTNNFEAEMGRAVGAVTNVTLKSGSNSLHGSVFEFIQNNATNARSYFSTAPLGHLSYNYFGGSLGGPIIKDKLFIFGDYLRSVDHEALSQNLTIPDPSYYTPNGAGNIDLSPLLQSGAGQVYDPATGDQIGGNRTPFANNQIPFSRVNPVSLALLTGLPKPNVAGATAAVPNNNYSINLPFRKEFNSFDIKSDYVMSEKNHFSYRYSYQQVHTFQQPTFSSFLGGPTGGGFEGNGNQTSYSTGLNYDRVFSPSLLTEVRVGIAHLRNVSQPSDYGTSDATKVGVPGVNIAGQPFTTGQVGVTVNGGFSNPVFGYSASMPWIRAEANIDAVNNWTKIIRNHTLKFGADVRRVRDDLLQDQTFSPRGAFTFDQNQSSECLVEKNGQCQTGAKTNIANNIASFLLDVPSQVGRDLNTYFPAYRQTWFFAFASDKWQATPKLTADFGIRWEFYPPATPRHSAGFSNYDPNTNSLVIAGVGGNPSNLGMKTQYKYFAPRVGLSYRASETTVIRGGFGLSYTPFPDNTYAYNYPVRANNSYQPGYNYGPAIFPGGAVATFQAGFPAPDPIVIPANGIINPAPISQVYTVIPLNYTNTYVESWNVAVQQALASSLSLQLAWVANHGVHMPVAQNINNPQYLGGGVDSEPFNKPQGGGGFLKTAAVNEYFLGFSSNYQSLQAQLTKRAGHGLSFTTAFTWSKALNYQDGDDGGVKFWAQLRRNYAPADYDRRLNYEQSVTWDLPFGFGHRWLSTGIPAETLGGWRVSAIISAVSGNPFTLSDNGGVLNTPGTQQTPDLVGAYRVLHGVGNKSFWFDTTAFGHPNGVRTGNVGRNQFYGPGWIQDNVSLFKNFKIYRESSLEFRIDAFQLSNTPQFSNPGTSATSSNFGRVTGTVGSGQGAVNGVGGGRSLQASAKIQF